MKHRIRDLVKKSRSYRRFHEPRRISRETLTGLVDIARFCPSSRNRQPLRYIISTDPEHTVKIRSCLLFALDLPGWGGPVEGERPVAYITILAEGEGTAFTKYDAGIAAQTLMLAAAEEGFGGCMFGSIKKEELRSVLSLSDRYEIHLVLAFGYRLNRWSSKKSGLMGIRDTGGILMGSTMSRNGHSRMWSCTARTEKARVLRKILV